MIYPVLYVDIYVISLFVLMESKKKAFPPLCRVPHSAKRALPSAVIMALGKAGKQRPNFPVLPSARAMTLGKDFFLKKEKISLPSARVWHSAKNFQKKKKKLFAECR